MNLSRSFVYAGSSRFWDAALAASYVRIPAIVNSQIAPW
jgi:hypothetical protein